MKREDVYTVKIYFVSPIDLITVVVNTLVELEYETYSVSEQDGDQLLKLLADNKRSLVFLSIANRHEAPRWLNFARRAKEVPGVQVGAFVYTNMGEVERRSFLDEQIPAISFGSITGNTVTVLDQILTVFDAKGTRRYVRVVARGISVAFIMVKGKDEPLRCNIVEISAFAMMCEVDETWRHFFKVGNYIPDVLLALRGIRIRTAIRVVGYSQENQNVFIVRFCGMEVVEGKMNYTDKVSGEIRQKVHTYVRACLKEDIVTQLEAVKVD